MTTNSPTFLSRTGFSARIIQRALFLFTLLSSSLACSADVSADISGTWKHVKMPIWVEIRMDQGDGIVVRNDQFPERVGKVFIKDLKADKSKQPYWNGTVYIRKIEDYKDVEISLSETGNMQITAKFAFFSRTFEWLRADNPVHVEIKFGDVRRKTP